MGPFLIVKQKRRIRCSAQLKRGAGYLDIAGQWAAADFNRTWAIAGNAEVRPAIFQSLPHVSNGLPMHVFMENGKKK